MTTLGDTQTDPSQQAIYRARAAAALARIHARTSNGLWPASDRLTTPTIDTDPAADTLTWADR